MDQHPELNELDRPPVGWPTAAPRLTLDAWVRRIPYALVALAGWFFVLPVLLGPVGVGVALIMTAASTWFFLGRSAPAVGQAYLVVTACPVVLIVLLFV